MAAVFRLPTLAVQHYWADEAVTAGLLHLNLGQMLATIPATESTPPLYYILAWGWTRVFGSGVFGLRSLSAVAGILSVPVIYWAGRPFVGRRAAFVAAALAAVSPALVWYSQEARAYSLLVLLCAISLLLFGRLLTSPSRQTFLLWSLVCVLALTTHYFAGFLILGEAFWLLVRGGQRVAAALACIPIVAAVFGLAFLAAHQRQQGHLSFISSSSLGARIADTAKVFASGQSGILVPVLPLVGVGLAALALALLVLAPPGDGRRLAPLAAVTAAAVVLPLLLALAGQDYVLARNLLALWPPIAILVAAGPTAPRTGWLGRLDAGALVALSVGLCIAVPLTPKLRREAINAQLASIPGQNAAVDISYVPVPPRTVRSGSATCPGGYQERLDELQTVGKTKGVPSSDAQARRLHDGSTATIENPTDHDVTYQLTVVCVPWPRRLG